MSRKRKEIEDTAPEYPNKRQNMTLDAPTVINGMLHRLPG
jgi:hypothetical protein